MALFLICQSKEKGKEGKKTNPRMEERVKCLPSRHQGKSEPMHS
jgi:hypothetical protein